MCGWRSSRLRRTYRRHFVQLGRGVLLLPSQGMLLTYSLDYMFKKLSAGYVAKVLISRFMTRFWVLMSSSFFCAMIAAITLKMLDPFGTGKLVLFQVTYDRVISSSYHDFYQLIFVRSGLACIRAVSICPSGRVWGASLPFGLCYVTLCCL